MAVVSYRLPRRLWLCGRMVAVKLATVEELRDVVGDHAGAEGAWDVDTHTIYLLRSLTPKQRARAFAHELIHAAVDCLDAS